MKKIKDLLRTLTLVLAMVGLCSASALAFTVTGTVTDDTGEPLIGVTVRVEGVAGGTVTDIDGVYKIEVPNPKKDVLTFTYVGMNQTSEKVNSREVVNIVMKSSDEALEELVVVGYGQQKKASVVGAIAQTSGATLARAGGVSSVGAALTGNLPGVTTMSSTGMPGAEDPKIVIRGQTSWLSLIHI